MKSYLKKKVRKSVKLLWFIVAHGNLTPMQLAIYCALKSFQGPLGLCPSASSIAIRAGCDRKTVFNVLAQFEQIRLVFRQKRAIRGQRTSNAYFLDDENFDALIARNLEAKKGAKKKVNKAEPLGNGRDEVYSAMGGTGVNLNQDTHAAPLETPNILPFSSPPKPPPAIPPAVPPKAETAE